MPTLPRTIPPISRGTTAPRFPDGFMASTSRGGRRQSRTVDSGGVIWRETYPDLNFSRAADRNLMTLLEYYRHRQVTIDLDHPTAAGSGRSPLGLGTAGIQVQGAGQTGDSIVTDGWPVTTSNVVRAGDWIAIGGLNYRFKIRANASSDGAGAATLTLVNPIFVGESPLDNAAVTTTGVTFKVQIVRGSDLSNVDAGINYRGIFAFFQEMP